MYGIKWLQTCTMTDVWTELASEKHTNTSVHWTDTELNDDPTKDRNDFKSCVLSQAWAELTVQLHSDASMDETDVRICIVTQTWTKCTLEHLRNYLTHELLTLLLSMNHKLYNNSEAVSQKLNLTQDTPLSPWNRGQGLKKQIFCTESYSTYELQAK
jgi:hypothetical protein